MEGITWQEEALAWALAVEAPVVVEAPAAEAEAPAAVQVLAASASARAAGIESRTSVACRVGR